jgi:signal transduction histidine kinase
MVPRAIKPGAGWDKSAGSRAVRALAALGAGLVLGLGSSTAHAAEAIGPFLTSDLLVLLIVLTAGALAIAGGLWGLAERRATLALRESLRTTTSRARALLAARDAWLSAGRESLMVWGADMSAPLSFGEGAALMEACLVGPDATDLSAALDALAANGTSFALTCRTTEGRDIHVRGRPAGGSVAVFLEPSGADQARSSDVQAILDAIPISIWLRRQEDLALTFVNKAFLTAAGVPSYETALQMNVAFDRSERDLASTAKNDNAPVEAKRFAVFAGRRHALHFMLAPLPNGSVLGSAVDVTASSEAEVKLQQHLDAHAQTLDRLATAIAIFGPDRKLTSYNQAYVRLWGLPEAWLDSHPSEGEILDRLRELRRLPEQPDFRAWKQERLKAFERVDQHPEELWHLPGGKTLRVVTQPQAFGGLTFLYEDVTDQLRLESSYNTLIKVQKATLDTLQEGVAVFGLDGRLKLYNAAFARIWRLEPAELSGEPHLNRIAEACATRFGNDRVWDDITSTVNAAPPERRREWGEVERSDGAIISLSIAPLPDGATLVTFVDATDRFRMEAALRERNEALEASDKLKSEFVKRVSYELRTPLNSIMGFAQLLLTNQKAGKLTAQQSEHAEAIVRASEGLRDLINDILDLSTIEAGAMELDLQEIDLYALLSGVAEHAQEWAGKIGLTLTLECRKDAGPFIADGRRIRQVLFNLLSNAFKFTPRTGHVTLGGDISGDDVRIFVADTGPGVSPELMPSAFERFSAKGVAVTRAGAGLGLALVNRFIELHHGWVELESEPGHGTRVTCHLPRRAEAHRRGGDPGTQARA